MREAILLILADAFECSARDVGGESRSARDYYAGMRAAYLDVASRLRAVVEKGGLESHSS